MSNKKFLIIPILLLILLSIGFVSASDNVTDESVSQPVDETPIYEEIDNDINGSSNIDSCPVSTKIESEDVATYYKENSEFVSYLKDCNINRFQIKRFQFL